MENSGFVRQHGLVRFQLNAKEHDTCPKCGGIISIHVGNGASVGKK